MSTVHKKMIIIDPCRGLENQQALAETYPGAKDLGGKGKPAHYDASDLIGLSIGVEPASPSYIYPTDSLHAGLGGTRFLDKDSDGALDHKPLWHDSRATRETPVNALGVDAKKASLPVNARGLIAAFEDGSKNAALNTLLIDIYYSPSTTGMQRAMVRALVGKELDSYPSHQRHELTTAITDFLLSQIDTYRVANSLMAAKKA